MSKSNYDEINIRNLFDVPFTPSSKEELVPPSATKEDDFFSKIDEVEIEHSVLGEEVETRVKAWVEEYNEFNAQIAKLKKALDAYSAFLDKTPVFNLKENTLYKYSIEDLNPKFEKESVLEPKDGLLAARIVDLVKNRWGVDLSRDDMLEKINFASADSILEYIAENINFGDTEGLILKQQMLKFKEEWKYIDFTHKGKKVFAQNAFYFNDFNMEYGNFSWENRRKLEILKEMLETYHKKTKGSTYSAINACFSYYTNRAKLKDCFEKVEEGYDTEVETITSTKLFKNGKFEMTFVSTEVAKEFFDEYITKAMMITEGA